MNAGSGPAALEGEPAHTIAREAERVHRGARGAIRVILQRPGGAERGFGVGLDRGGADEVRRAGLRADRRCAGGLATLPPAPVLRHHPDDLVCFFFHHSATTEIYTLLSAASLC